MYYGNVLNELWLEKLCGIAEFNNFTAKSESEKTGSDPHHWGRQRGAQVRCSDHEMIFVSKEIGLMKPTKKVMMNWRKADWVTA
jgi:hypothetical protein